MRSNILLWGSYAAILTSDFPQEFQLEVVKKFQQGVFPILVTTQILCRGIDIPNAEVVVNFDIPSNEHNVPDAKNYLYRVSRCGRFGLLTISKILFLQILLNIFLLFFKVNLALH